MARKANGRLTRLGNELGRMANAVFKSDEYRRFLSLPLTRERAAFYIFERSHFHLNRRQCWALVQAHAPFDVKQIIWHHEREELDGDKARGVENHWVLGIKEGRTVGLKPRDFNRPPSDGTRICTYAWAHIAQTADWLEAIAASGMLEIANSDAIVKGGGNARRIGEKMRDELGIPFDRQQSNAEHMTAEIEHAHLLMRAAETHGRTKDAQAQIIRGARVSLAIDCVYKDALAGAMEETANAAAA